MSREPRATGPTAMAWRGHDRCVGRILIPTLLGVSLLIGCGRRTAPRGEVTGRVSRAGIPVNGGSIVFSRSDGTAAVMVPLESDGSFMARTYQGVGLVVGTYRVSLSPQKPATSGHAVLVDPAGESQAQPRVPNAATSRNSAPLDLTLEVVEGRNPPVIIDLPR